MSINFLIMMLKGGDCLIAYTVYSGKVVSLFLGWDYLQFMRAARQTWDTVVCWEDATKFCCVGFFYVFQDFQWMEEDTFY